MVNAFCRTLLTRARVAMTKDFAKNLEIDEFISYCPTYKGADCQISHFKAFFHPNFKKCLLFNEGNKLKCDNRELLKQFQKLANKCLEKYPTNVVSTIVENMRYLDHLVELQNLSDFPTDSKCSKSSEKFKLDYKKFN